MAKTSQRPSMCVHAAPLCSLVATQYTMKKCNGCRAHAHTQSIDALCVVRCARFFGTSRQAKPVCELEELLIIARSRQIVAAAISPHMLEDRYPSLPLSLTRPFVRTHTSAEAHTRTNTHPQAQCTSPGRTLCFTHAHMRMCASAACERAHTHPPTRARRFVYSLPVLVSQSSR
jgi:hypothetical protein